MIDSSNRLLQSILKKAYLTILSPWSQILVFILFLWFWGLVCDQRIIDVTIILRIICKHILIGCPQCTILLLRWGILILKPVHFSYTYRLMLFLCTINFLIDIHRAQHIDWLILLFIHGLYHQWIITFIHIKRRIGNSLLCRLRIHLKCKRLGPYFIIGCVISCLLHSNLMTQIGIWFYIHHTRLAFIRSLRPKFIIIANCNLNRRGLIWF